MSNELTYAIGRYVGRHPGKTLAATAMTIGLAAITQCSTAPEKQPDVAAKAQPISQTERCHQQREEQLATHKQLSATDLHQQAANTLRHCAQQLNDPELKKLVDESDFKYHLKNANDETLSVQARHAAAAAALVRKPQHKEAAALHDRLEKPLRQQAKAAEKQRAAEARALAKAKKSAGVHIGMTQQDVINSSWGQPESINTTQTSRKTRHQWVYGIGNYLYFEDGILVGIQTKN